MPGQPRQSSIAPEEENPLATARDGAGPRCGTAPHGASAREVFQFLRRSLEVVRHEMGLSVKLQGEMAERISHHAVALMPGLSDERTGEVTGLMTALQNDDRIRQRHEGLVAVLNTLIEVLQETEHADAPASCAALNTEIAIQERWVKRLLESQSLEELEKSFARGLAAD